MAQPCRVVPRRTVGERNSLGCECMTQEVFVFVSAGVLYALGRVSGVPCAGVDIRGLLSMPVFALKFVGEFP